MEEDNHERAGGFPGRAGCFWPTQQPRGVADRGEGWYEICYNGDYGDNFIADTVTHWMPLH